ncbi:DNA primase family protein [uncultured Methylobacterium sp.]|uniref:DNA primase family protein n=1 Tax=uncultured Methylobacterium sp. TaxID=157278 RepID=UPI0026064269|nr:DNA primase family protein [uncultured Methylobacterium sp.]
MVGAICAAISDEEEDDRLRCVGTTYDQIDRGGVVAGNRDLIDHVGEHAFSKIQTWLGGSRPPVRTATHAPSRAAVFDPGTDISTGQAFSSSLNGDLIYSDREDQFYLREFDVYAPVSVHHVKSLAIGFIRNDSDPQLYQNVAAIKGSQSIKRVNAILEIAKTQLIADSHRFDSEPMLVGSRNGVIDLSIGAFSRPEGINTKRIGTYFDPGAKAPTFDSYLSAVFQGDIEKIEFIRRAVGYTLTGSVAAQCMFVLIGRGANGKSTFLNILRALLGDYAGTIMFQSLMVQKYANRVNDDIASLKGARFVSTQEGEVGQRLAVSRVKELTGGDTIQCRRLYEDFFYMKPEFKIWLSTNDLPDIPGGDDAIWRRLHIIDFPRVFGPDEQDPQLLNKLKAELPGILNWALEGIRQIGEMNGDFLNPPSSIREVTQLYRDDNDSVKKFMDECCSMKEGVKTMSSLLYRGYQGWCEYNGAAPVTARAFGLRLNELGIESRRTSSGIQRINIEMI